MPELPEVENIRTELEKLLTSTKRFIKTERSDKYTVINRIELKRRKIRFAIPDILQEKVCKQKILKVRRRAKYLLFDLENGSLLSHLGMTGNWLQVNEGKENKHDHCYLHLQDGRRLAFRDPRRFGILDWIEPGEEAHHPRLKHLGPEPLDEQKCTAEYLHRLSRRKSVAIKNFIMNQKIIVGVGNIYACEALFHAQIRPQKKAGKITQNEILRLLTSIRHVLHKAIQAGGSSISDFLHTDGSYGSAQDDFFTYGRTGEACLNCSSLILTERIGGRSSFWCPQCQKS